MNEHVHPALRGVVNAVAIRTPARAAAEALGDGLLGFYLRESAICDRLINQALATERAEIAHRLRLIFKDAATFYEINEALAFANELDPS